MDNEKTLEAVADRLHKIQCHWNHTDQCAYYYGPWHRLQALERYYPKAEKLLAVASADSIFTILDSLAN